MSISQAYTLATDGEFRLLAGFTSPPRPGTVTALEGSGQVRVAMNDADGADVLAWPLNGLAYGVGDLVYVAFATDSPESGIVVGAKGSVPRMATLPADWDIGEDRRLRVEGVRARDGEGLRLEDDGGNLGVTVFDTGKVGIGPGVTVAANTLTAKDGSGVWTVVDVQPSGSGVSAAFMFNAAAAISGTNPQWFIGERFNAQGPLSIWQFNGAAHEGNAVTIDAENQVGMGVSAPQGRLHAHDGTGGLIFATKTGINSTTPQVILPNGAGDVVRGFAGSYVATDGTVSAAGALALTTPEYLDVVVGSVTLRVEVLSTGVLQVKRQGGTGTGSIAIMGCWM